MLKKYNNEIRQEVGIVLHHRGRNLTLFERTERRIDGVAYSKNIARGTFISYTTAHINKDVIFENIKLEYTPLIQARADIYFLHALIELCYYFIPEGSNEYQVYPFLVRVFRSFQTIESGYVKKRLLCRMFAYLGIHPLLSYEGTQLEDFLSIPIDNLIVGKLELADEDFFERWIAWCLDTHPQGKKCKALPLILQK